MRKTIIFARASLVDSNNKIYEGIDKLINQLNEDGDDVVIMSHDHSQIQRFLEKYDFVKKAYRWQIREYLKDESGNCVIVGSNNDDLKIASNRKTALFVPNWSDTQEELPNIYGLKVSTPEILYQIIQILKNQKHWYYELQVDEKTKVYSLTSGNSKGYVPKEEKEIVEGFNKLLKKGNKRYFKVLEYHFLASLMHLEEFKEVNIWGIMPSSSGLYNEDLLALKERARVLMGKKQKQHVLERHTAIGKSHYIKNQSERLYCNRHFSSMRINPYFKKGKKLKGKVVCIMDDYLTNGTSFETVRNLLLNEGVKKVIFVSLGKFTRSSGIEYYKQDYVISGDVYSDDYGYTLVNESDLRGIYNNSAKEDIRSLHSILFE